MGKAIRNFKDAISGVEEASFRKLDEQGQSQKTAESADTAQKQNPPEDKV
jgi:Sec-independent protein translocase protein TatA